MHEICLELSILVSGLLKGCFMIVDRILDLERLAQRYLLKERGRSIRFFGTVAVVLTVVLLSEL